MGNFPALDQRNRPGGSRTEGAAAIRQGLCVCVHAVYVSIFQCLGQRVHLCMHQHPCVRVIFAGWRVLRSGHKQGRRSAGVGIGAVWPGHDARLVPHVQNNDACVWIGHSQVDEFGEWVDGLAARQAKLKGHEAPVLLADEVYVRLAVVRKVHAAAPPASHTRTLPSPRKTLGRPCSGLVQWTGMTLWEGPESLPSFVSFL
jgi:hypothetical protein